MKLEEAVERLKELMKDEHKEWIGITNQEAIKTVYVALFEAKEANRQLQIELDKKDKLIEELKKSKKVLIDGYINKCKEYERLLSDNEIF